MALTTLARATITLGSIGLLTGAAAAQQRG